MIPPGFLGTHLPRSPNGIVAAASLIKCDPLVIQAVIDVETGNAGFLGDGRPKILCERHHFSDLTHGHFDEAYPQVSNPTPGGYYGGTSEYLRLKIMMGLDRNAALLSTSWGLPQIMGSNFAAAGYSDVEGMVADFCAGEDQQLAAMAHFIVKAGLADELQREDFTDFAMRYNGPNYASNSYDKRLVSDLSRLRAMSAASISEAWPAQRQLIGRVQATLNLDGYGPLTVDGWLGSKTGSALRRFQVANGLNQTGHADKATLLVLLGETVGA